MRRRVTSRAAAGPFADLHVHLVPGVDDGPDTLDETVAMLRAAHRAGTRRIVATPHCYSPHFPPVAVTDLRRAGDAMLAALRRLETREENCFLSEMTVALGAENHLSPELFAALERSQVLALAASRYLLIELSPFQTPEVVHTAVSRIQDAGFIPVVAHVERYFAFESSPSHLEGLVASGCILQVNAESVLGGWRSPVRRRVHRLLADGLVQLLASDGHDLHRRPPELAQAHGALARQFPADSLARWMWQNPAAILDDLPLPV